MVVNRAHVLRRQYDLPLGDLWLGVTEWSADEPEVTVVLTHGWTLSSMVWEDVAEALVAADPAVRVIAYDHRGHGLSARIGTASIDELADDLAAIVTALVPTGPIVFGGHSLGGMTLMALAHRHPALVAGRAAGAAFVATSSGQLLGAIRKVRGVERLLTVCLVIAARFAMPSKPLFLLRQGARAGFGKRPRRHDLNRAVLQSAQSDPRAVAALGRSILEHSRVEHLSAFGGADVVVMAGTRDFLTPPGHARRIAEALPNSRIVVFPGAGHFLPYERREAVAEHLLDLAVQARARKANALGA